MPGGKAWCGTIGPRNATVPPSVARNLGDDDRAGAAARRSDRAERDRRSAGRRRRGAPASSAGFAEDRHVDQIVSRSRQAGLSASRSGERHAAMTAPALRRRTPGLGEAERDRAGQDQRVASFVAPLRARTLRIEGMVQHERAAAEQPRQQRQAMPANDDGARVDRMVASCASAAFEQARRARRRSVRDDCAPPAPGRPAPTSKVIGGDVRRGIVLPSRSSGGIGSTLLGVEQIVERHDAVGQVFAEAADIADRKHLGRDAHGEIGND